MKDTMTEEERDTMTWADFVARFTEEFAPRVEIERMGQEYLQLEQTTESVREITDRFREMVLMCPEVTGMERMRMCRYVSMLRTYIKDFVRGARCENLATMYEVARERERERERE